VNAVVNLLVPLNAGNFMKSLSGRTLLHGVSYDISFVFFLDICGRKRTELNSLMPSYSNKSLR